MKQLALLIIFFLFLFSCSKVETKDLTVIDNIVLGQSQKDLYRYLDSIGLEKERFLLKKDLTDDDLTNDNSLTFYKTNLFNFKKYKLSDFDHLGVYYPITLKGTDRVIGLNVILGHVVHPSLISKKYGNIIDITTKNKIRGFYQDINFNLMSEIISMINSKYGEPKEIIKSKNDQFFVLENGEVNKYNAPDENIGDKIVWESKELTVYLYLGIASYRTVYNLDTKSYSYFFDNSKVQKPNFKDNETGCYSFAYIHYEIKEQSLEKLELNKPNI